MKTFLLKSHFLTIVFLIVNLFFGGVAFGQATVTTDKLDYAPGEIAIVTGSGWTGDTLVDLHFEEDPFVDDIHDYHDIPVNPDGTFRVEFPILDRHLGVTFTLTAEGKQTGRTAQHIFTDSHSVSSFTPTSGPTSGGTSINISGSGFGPDTQAGTWMVKFGSLTAVSAVRNSSNSLTVISPPHPAGPVSITVYPSNQITDPVTAGASFTYTGTSATTLTVSSASGTYNGTTTLTAILTSGSPAAGVSGKTITFSLNGTSVGTAFTNASGIATLNNVSLSGINAGSYPTGVSASFNADATYSGSTGANNLTINRATPTATLAVSNTPQTYTGLGQSATVSISASSVPGTVANILTGGLETQTNANTYAVTANFVPNDAANYNSLTALSAGNFVIGKATPTATLAVSNTPQTYTGSGQAATVTISVSSVPGSVSNILTGGAATQSNAATYAVTANFFPTDTANYNSLIGLSAGNFVIGKATPTATLAVSNTPQTYTGSGQAATVTISSSSVSGAVSNILTGGAATQSNAATYAVTANFFPTDTANYNSLIGLSAGNFVIGKATPTATLAVSNTPQTYTGSGQAATVTISASSVPGSVSNILTGGSATQTNANTYTVTADFVPNDAANYNSLTALAAGNFVIGKAASVTTVTITGAPFTYTGSAITPASVSVTGAGGLSLTPAAVYADNTNAGTANASYTFAGDDNHFGSNENKDFTIGKKTASVTPATGQTKVYGSVDPILTGSTNGFVSTDNVEETYSRLAGETVLGSPYTISAVLTPAVILSNYNITYNTANFTITPLTVSVTANVGQNKVYGSVNPTYTYTSTPAVGFALPNTDLISFTGAMSRVTGENAGNYAIIQGNLANSNYTITFNTTNFAITPLAVTVTANVGQNKVYGSVNPTYTYTSTPAVGFALANTDLISFTGAMSRVTGENVGSYAITQGNLANSNYTITFNTTNFAITPLAVTVTADAKTKVYGQVDPALTFVSSPAVGSFLANGQNISFTGLLSRLAGETVVGSPYAIGQNTVANSNYTITYVGANLAITQASTTNSLTLSAVSVRYMDNITMTAVVKPLNTATPLTGTIEFKIGSVVYGTATVVPIPGATDGSVQAMLIKQVAEMPANYTVTATFTCTNTNYTSSNNTKPLTVIARDASPYLSTGFYTGDLFAWTTGPNTSTATVTLVAALKDASTTTGDLRSAKVTFYLVNGTTYTPISSAQNLPVGLVDVTDGSVGTASAIVQLNIGSSNAASFQIAVGVSGAYTNNPGSILSQSIVTVSKPVAGGYIVGGGQVSNSNSSGYIKGASEVNTGYQFDIQYTKSGTNPKGKVNIMLGSYYKSDGTLDSKLHTYIITTNAIALLNVTNPVATGIFDAKANLVEQIGDGITVPFSTVAIEGGSTFQMKAYQNVCDQQIAITLYRKAGGVWYSSNWNTTTASTSLKIVSNTSNVYVSGGGNCTGSISSTKLVSSSLNNASVAGEMVTFKATVSGTAVTPTGTIAFKKGTTTLATVNLIGGIASYSSNTFTVGSHQIVASYSGDLKSKASDSSILTQTVNSAPSARTSAPVIGKQVEEIAVETVPFNVIVYPNPSNQYFNVEMKGGSTEKVDIMVYDVLGRTIKHIESSDGQFIRFGDELSTGAYFARISQGINQKTVRLIKQ